MKSFGARAAALAISVLGCVGCGVGGDEGLEGAERVTSPIVGGSTASAYPESVLVEMLQQGALRAACSGTIIAPQVVLTAGHCVATFTGWRVEAPFLGQASTSSSAETFDWTSDGSENVNPSEHDLGLVYLDSAISAPQYPALADAPVADGSSIVDIGRIDDGTLSNTALFVSKPITVQNAAPFGYPYDYLSDAVIQPGDSGGPVEVPGTTPHALVGVNSGAGSTTEVLARVDLLKSWIGDRVSSHGGAAPAPAPAGAPACAGPTEVEPNDSYQTPNALGPTVCGGVGGADTQDWYTWSIDGATPYTVTLSTTGDATLAMWKLDDGAYARVQNTTATEIAHTASGAGTYVLAVYTPSDAAQSYTLSLNK